MTRYVCERMDEGVVCIVTENKVGGFYLDNIGLHSPSGFEMGYGGSGPADLALTILAHHLGAEDATRPNYMSTGPLSEQARLAWRLHQDFKFKFITPDQNRAVISSEEIDAWLAEQEHPTT